MHPRQGLVYHQSPRQLVTGGSIFRPSTPGEAWEAILLLLPTLGGLGETRCVTPRQACPQPEGFGRNLRSKTRWFTGFCNSHQVSHFATFFIDARAEISVAESRLIFLYDWVPRPCPANRARWAHLYPCSLAQTVPGFVIVPRRYS